MHLEPGTVIERWVVQAHVASGGMASVYLVRHEALGSLHALKVLHPELAPQEPRLLGEGRAQSSLLHPNIVAVTDTVSVAGRLGLIMEWVSGPSLADWLAARRATEAQLDVIARDLLRGLIVAHEAGWVHRDLKPANVLLQVTGDALVPKITDFGIAKRRLPQTGVETEPGRMFGTPAYMAPEQMRDAATVDARADLYALGVMLYEMAAGFRPFPGHDPIVLAAAITKGAPPLAEVAPGLPPRVYAAIDAALVVDRDERVASARDFLDRWTSDGDRAVPRPTHPWTDADLEAAKDALPSLPGSTWSPSEMPTVRGVTGETSSPPRTWGWIAAALASAALVVVTLMVAQRPVVPDGPPVVSDQPDVQRRFLLGWEQWADARFPAAEATFTSVALDAEASPLPHLMMASTHIARERWEPAMDAFEEAEARLGADDTAIAALIETYRRSVGGIEVERWAVLAADHPRDLLIQVTACVELAGWPESRAACQRARRIDDMAILDWIEAEIAINTLRFTEAETLVEAFLDRSPAHPLGLAQMSRIHAGRGDWQPAKVWAERATEADPQAWVPRVALARALAPHGVDDGRRPQMARATSPAQKRTDRILALVADSETSFGLVQFPRAFDDLRRAGVLAREERDWYSHSLAASLLGQRAWHMRDADVLAEARGLLGEAAASPEVHESNAQRMRVSLLYIRGLEGVLREDRTEVVEARDRLAGLTDGWSGWVSRDAAVGILGAFADALAGDDTALRQIALQFPGCELDYRGGAYLLDHGEVEAGLERLHRTAETCIAWGPAAFFRYRAVERLLAHAKAQGDAGARSTYETLLEALRSE
ncbi:MAG: serine/threonine-protein kinase [Myxococcota bacterium]